jgi:GTPase
MAEFIDEARILVTAGDGGHGSASFLREKHKPKGRPDGGNGGNGGSIILRVDINMATLSDLARNPHHRAGSGVNGSAKHKDGAAGDDRVVLVPDGTMVRDSGSGEVLADLVGHGSEFVVARGGRGGRGNASLATARRRAPGFAERGEEGESRWLALELKVLADVGLVGFPNAGKSSLISKLSAARPKIAAYPFTTLTPNLGVAETGGGRFVIADVPGLIEGASEGRGLGLEFLRHLERCLVLCFVIDVSAPETPTAALQALRGELRAHDASFDTRIGVVAANKIDLSTDAVEDARTAAADAGFAFVAVSAETDEGIEELATLLADAVERAVTTTPQPVSHRLIRLRPEEKEVVVEREGNVWRVRSERVERLLQRFDISNPDALLFVQDRFEAFGVEAALSRAGAQPGDDVAIGDLVFEFEPEDHTGRRRR